MFTRKFNDAVTIISQILNYLVIIIFVLLLSTLILWIINPAEGDIYLDNTIDFTSMDTSKYIIDQKIFGVPVIPVTPPVVIPRLYTSIKLNGVYYNPPNQSIAFITYQNKIYYLKEKDSIIKPNVHLYKIAPNYIIVEENRKLDRVEESKM